MYLQKYFQSGTLDARYVIEQLGRVINLWH